MKTFYWLLKRETWEHRSFLIVPVVIGCLAVLFMLIGLFRMMASLEGMQHLREHIPFGTMDPGGHHLAVIGGVLTTSVPFNAVMLILIGVFLLDSLYSERRDRSILFWKSLPISDTTVVLSKLATAVVVAPLVTLAVVAVTQLAVLLIASIGFLFIGVEGWGWLWNPLYWLMGWACLVYAYFVIALILMPYIAWLMLASSWARRAPFLWAAVPPVALMILERWFLGSTYLANAVFGHINDLLPVAFKSTSVESMGEFSSGHDESVALPSLELFAEPGLWVGLTVAAALIYGAIRLRQYRDEV